MRDCRAEDEGQLGREDQGTESCGMPDAAAASAGWSPWTHCMYMARRGERLWPLGNTEVRYTQLWMAGICLTPGSRQDQEGLW